MTALEIGNNALKNAGITVEVEALDEASPEALLLRRFHDHVLRACLRRFPWAFATKYAELTLVRGPFWETDPTALTLVQAWSNTATYVAGDVVRNDDLNYYCLLANTATEPPNATYWSTSEDDAPDYANGDWLYGYRQPSDCLYERRLVEASTGRKFNPTAIPFRVGRDDNGLLVFTDRQEAVLEYTMLDCTNLWSNDLFLLYFEWSLTAAVIPGLERAQKSVVDALKIAEMYYSLATSRDSNESQQEPPGDPDWIRGR